MPLCAAIYGRHCAEPAPGLPGWKGLRTNSALRGLQVFEPPLKRASLSQASRMGRARMRALRGHAVGSLGRGEGQVPTFTESLCSTVRSYAHAIGALISLPFPPSHSLPLTSLPLTSLPLTSLLFGLLIALLISLLISFRISLIRSS